MKAYWCTRPIPMELKSFLNLPCHRSCGGWLFPSHLCNIQGAGVEGGGNLTLRLWEEVTPAVHVPYRYCHMAVYPRLPDPRYMRATCTGPHVCAWYTFTILLSRIFDHSISIWACKKWRKGCNENSDLENTDLRPRKTQTPWLSRKHRPSIQYFSNVDIIEYL